MSICSNIVWLADTNYRIDLDNSLVRALAAQEDYDALLAADQVRFQHQHPRPIQLVCLETLSFLGHPAHPAPFKNARSLMTV